MNVEKLKLETRHNASIEFSMTIIDLQTNLPVDLSAAEIWFTAKLSADDADNAAVIQVTKTGGNIVVSGTDHNILTVRADNVANTSPNALPNEPVTLVCDVKVQLPDDFAQVVGEGTLKVSKAVTQSG